MKWSPNGQILLTCAKEETVKLWAPLYCDSGQGSGWCCLQSLRHPSLVNGVAWCDLPGRGPKPLNMLAMYVCSACQRLDILRICRFTCYSLSLRLHHLHLVLSRSGFQDVLVVNCSKEFMASNHVLATCRTALKKQGVVGLNMAPCMRAFLERLPVMLQEQYTYEKVLELGWVSPNFLIHSSCSLFCSQGVLQVFQRSFRCFLLSRSWFRC
ncbi:hypothetical protein XENOCAPTIV_018529 [Xenoophorus captivus]|uniref:Uncharacterized protein n=1 Tax=Xenoophorus captivus TaxID=1517983 RepID=A0ABV0R9G8_9TELE